MLRFFASLMLLLSTVLPASAVMGKDGEAYAHAGVVVSLPPGVQALENGWREHDGDDLAWAASGYDDSRWSGVTPGLSSDPTVRPGWRWYRLRLELPPGHPPLALMLAGPDGAYEVYLNGVRVPEAQIRGLWHLFSGRERAMALNSAGTWVQLAIRVRFPALQDTEIYGLRFRRALLGPVDAIEAQRRLALDDRLVAILPGWADDLATLLGGCVAMLLFFLRRTSREYLYLGLYLAASAFGMFTFYGVMAGFLPAALNNFIGDPLGYPGLILEIEFTFAFLSRRVGRGWRGLEVLLLAGPVCAALLNVGWLGPDAYLLVEGAANLSVAVALPVLLMVLWLRGSSDAGWLVLPSLAPAVAGVVQDLGLVAPLAGWSRLVVLGQPIAVGPLALNVEDVANVLYLLGIVVVMMLRFTRLSREEARASAELGAAREVQQRLVPSELPDVAGYALEAAYLPADEVGGDFYQVLAQSDDSMLIVVGDVSGKGLRAAMTGALAIGALRTLAAEGLGPAELLRRLNGQIAAAQDGGFITCICARLENDRLTIANAGHLSPYRNGEEVVVDSGFPLGIVAGAEYGETVATLAAGDRMTFLSDGVLEARAEDGALLGFERMAELSIQSAAEIAQAAQAFGQDDDITVLTLTFAGSEGMLA
jgi:hypothetical protein